MNQAPPQSRALPGANPRPVKLYRYSQREWLERSLQLGEFRLRPPTALPIPANGSGPILPFGPKPSVTSNYLTLSLASAWDESLFDVFEGSDACLIIHDTEQFGERIHRATQRLLPSWAGIDAAISYGLPSPLGAIFSKCREQMTEREWLFAWRPVQRGLVATPAVIRIGSIEGIAELKVRDW